MSDVAHGPGWWMASDGKWYPPELHPDVTSPQPLPSVDWVPGSQSGDAPPLASTVRVPSVSHDNDDDDHLRSSDLLAAWAPSVAPPLNGPPIGDYSVEGSATGRPSSVPSFPTAVSGNPPTRQTPPPSSFDQRSSGPTGRFSRGLRLVGIGFTMARDEPGLMLVPIVAFCLQLVVFGLAGLMLLPTFRSASRSDGTPVHLSVGQWLIMVVAGVVVMFITVVSHATIIARVMARFHGQNVTNTAAARAALSKAPELMAWAFINYVVVSILRNIGNRGIIGFLIGAALRAGWLLASFFVVPVILFEDRGAVASIKRSVQLCRARWGENIIGNSALGVIGVVAVLADVAVAVVVGSVFAPFGIALGLIGLAMILLVLTVASGAFNAALYWYAVTDQSPGQYSVGDLQSAYRPKGARL